MPANSMGRVSYGADVYSAFKYGRLNVVARIPVQAGETISARARFNCAFHPHRRPGARIRSELFAFYCPLRWSYPTIVVALTGKYDNSSTWLTKTNLTTTKNGLNALATHRSDVPLHWVKDYAAIIEHHFKERHITTEVTKDNVLISDADHDFGYMCWNVKDSPVTRLNWDDAHDATELASDDNIPALDLAKYVALGREDQHREWESVRVEELYRSVYGGKLGRDVLQVPILLGHEAGNTRMGSEEVDALQDISMGRQMCTVSLRIPRWRVAEHGTIYMLHLSRIKPVYKRAENYLDNPTQMAVTKNMSGHPVSVHEKPVEMTLAKMFDDSASSTSLGWKPFGQWNEESVPFVHYLYDVNDEGWHFLNTPGSKLALHRHPEYDDLQTTVQYGSGQLIGTYSVNSMRTKSVSSVKGANVGGSQGSL